MAARGAESGQRWVDSVVLEEALRYLREGLEFTGPYALRTIRVLFVQGAASAAALRGNFELAASLLGARATIAADVGETERELRLEAERQARASLGNPQFTKLSAAGTRLGIDEVTELAESWLRETAR